MILTNISPRLYILERVGIRTKNIVNLGLSSIKTFSADKRNFFI